MLAPQITKQVIGYTGNVADFLVRNSDNVVKFGIPTAVGGILGAQTYVDVKNVEGKDDKRNTIINNVLIGAAMVAGGMLSHWRAKIFFRRYEPGRIVTAIRNNNFLKRIIPKFLKNYPAREFFETLSIPIGAGIAGGITGELAQNKFPVDSVKYNVMERAGLLRDIDYDSLNRVYGLENIGATKSMDGAFSTLVGFNVGREKGIKNKIKTFVSELISGAIIPLGVVIPMTGYLNKILPNDSIKLKEMYKKGVIKKMKPGGLLKTVKGLKSGLIIGGAILASMAGKAAATWFNKEITENFVENQVWADISKKQKELMKRSMMTHNQFEKEKIKDELKRLSEVKKKIKD